MEDRERQIEEMAKEMCGGCYDGKECMHGLCADWYKAEKLYNEDYRKIPKDSVVLSADEFANLKKYAYKKGSKETAEKILSLYTLSDTFSSFQEKIIKQFDIEIKE